MSTEQVYLPTALVVGQAKLTAGGTSQQLSTTSLPLTLGLVVTAKSGNNAAGVTLGFTTALTATADGTGNGYILAPGASVTLLVSNVNVVYFNGTTADILSYLGS